MSRPAPIRNRLTDLLGIDYPIVQAVIIISALVFVLVNLAIDLLYTWLDPRISFART